MIWNAKWQQILQISCFQLPPNRTSTKPSAITEWSPRCTPTTPSKTAKLYKTKDPLTKDNIHLTPGAKIHVVAKELESRMLRRNPTHHPQDSAITRGKTTTNQPPPNKTTGTRQNNNNVNQERVHRKSDWKGRREMQNTDQTQHNHHHRGQRRGNKNHNIRNTKKWPIHKTGHLGHNWKGKKQQRKQTLETTEHE